MQALALDMGGTHISCGVVESKRLLASTSLDIEEAQSLGGLLPALENALHALLREAGTTAERCSGIAIGFPGIVDVRDGKIHSTFKKYEDAAKLNLAAWARNTFGLPLRIENDARMALLGEHYAGAGCGVANLVMMTLGTGIGTAVLLNGQPLRGVHGHAGCLGGHLTANFDGRPCPCGNVGCAETEASGWSIPLIVHEWPGFRQSTLAELKTLGFRELFAHAEFGDHVACEVREHCLRVWGANAVSLIHAYDPEMLILGGGVMQNPEIVLPFVQDYIDTHTCSSWGKVRVQAAALGNRAALLGAVPLLVEEMHGAQIELR